MGLEGHANYFIMGRAENYNTLIEGRGDNLDPEIEEGSTLQLDFKKLSKVANAGTDVKVLAIDGETILE